MKDKVYVIPCGGIGKATASVGREAAYVVVEDARPGDSDILCLSLLTKGDEDALEKVRRNKVITLEGCARDCARKNVEAAGGIPESSHRVHDYLKEHKDLKPEGVLDIGEGGRMLAHLIAEEISNEIDDMVRGE